MSTLKIKRLSTLPGTLDASTLYIIQGDLATDVNLYFTGDDEAEVRRVLTRADVASMISAATSGEADRLSTARVIEATGDITWEVTFDGSQDVAAAASLSETGVTAGTYPKVTVDAKGRVTEGAALVAADIPATIDSDTTGNAATATLAATATIADEATQLATARTINGVEFDGTQNIVINAEDAVARIAVSEKGAANGVAPLNSAGQVDSGYLPSYVDDVLEFADFASLPVTGEQGKIYVTLDNNRTYRWSGSAYIWVGAEADTADTADSLSTARTIETTGDVIWEVSFDGSQDVAAAAALSETGVVAGTYPKVTVDAKGRVTGGAALVSGDIPDNAANTTGNAGGLDIGTADW